MLLAFILPMEIDAPWIQIGPLDVTNVEICLGIVLLLALVRWAIDGQPALRIPRTWQLLGAFFLAALLISTLAAPVYRENSLLATLRTLSGIALTLATIIIVRSKRDLAYVAAALAGGALVASIIGLAEIAQGDEIAWLSYFREAPTVAGGILRLSGTFDYSNQAAMFIEATLPLLAALVVLAWRRKRTGLTIGLFLGAMILVQTALFSYSRSAIALVVLFSLMAIFGSIWIRNRRSFDGANVLIFLGLGALLIVVVNVLTDPAWRLRLTSEGDIAWYQIEMQAPAILNLEANQEELVTITVKNEGVLSWTSSGISPIYLSARWVHPESENQFAKQPRWALARTIDPGETETMDVLLRAPAVAGEFTLIWDLVQENVTWFGAKTGNETSTEVSVSGDGSLSEAEQGLVESGELVEEWQIPAPIPGRSVLWRAALDLWQERPILGIGLDNFRLRYGEELGHELYDQSIHTNNWYIEMVVSLGLLGALPFLIWLGVLVIDMIRRIRTGGIWTVAIAVALIAYLLHGLLDYFLLFNPTGLLFWMLVGMWTALNYQMEGEEVVCA